MKPVSLPNIRIIYRGDSQKKLGQVNYHPIMESEQSKHRGQAFDFRNKLDSRDEIIRIPLKIKKGDSVFTEDYQCVILDWLANMVENILSVTFKHILSQNLTVLEGKAYASKNILLNIKETCEQIQKVFDQDIEAPFIQFLDKSLQEIISELINKYPQQNTKGASRKVKDFIKKISNRQNDQYDFLYKNNISFKYNSSGDYSQEIMKIINKIINMPQENSNRINQNIQKQKCDVLFHQFQSFCANLFYQSTKKIQESPTSSRTKQVNFLQHTWADKPKEETTSHLKNTLESNKKTIKLGYGRTSSDLQQFKTIDVNQEEIQKIIQSEYEITQQFMKFEEKKGPFYAICQKIPSQVKTFNQKEVRSGKFRAYHASISRVITKWAESLYQKFQEANDKIRYRLFKFKINERMINTCDSQIGETKLRYCEVQQKQFLYQAAINQRMKVEKYFENLKKDNKQLQAILSRENLQGMYVKKYTNVGIFAGRIQQILNQLTFKYLNQLIHSLLSVTLQASQRIYEHYRIYGKDLVTAEAKKQDLNKINLINFNVADLLRARYICLEHQFINVLAYLYKIQETNPLFLKIVKIKNRLDTKNNDILINFFFRNTIMCELQLAIFKETNKKQHLYSQFNHFLYELKRSSFGVISALSNIIAEHDPVVNQFTFNKLKHPKLITPTPREKVSHSSKMFLLRGQNLIENFFISRNVIQKTIEIPFICSSCKLLKIVHNTKFYQRSLELQAVCNQCIEKNLKQSPTKYKQVIENLFKFYVLDDNVSSSPFFNSISLWNPNQELKAIKEQTELYAKFLEHGFIIQKGEKLPKVRFFKKFFNPIKNSLILSTVIGGSVMNFLRLDCKKSSSSFDFLNQLDKFLIFKIEGEVQMQNVKQLEAFIAEQNQKADFLQVLDLRHKQILKIEYIEEIQSSFEKYYSTLYLNNYKNVLEYLEEYALFQAQQSKHSNISPFQKRASYVTNLQLQSCLIYELNFVISEFINLKELNLSNNLIKDLKPLKQLQRLEILNISHNRVTTLQHICELSELTVLIAIDNIISSLKYTHKLKKLTKLDCSRNSVKNLQGVKGLQNLKSLDISHNYVSCLQQIQHLKKLQKLFLSENELKEVKYLDKLVNLVEMELSFNKAFTEFPCFSKNCNLTVLKLTNNLICAISPLDCLKLKKLSLSKNKIKKIENLESLSELQQLDLSQNQIQKLQNLDKLVKLKFLIIRKNKISVIQNLQNLAMLQKVIFSQNPIQQIANLNHLRYLNYINFEGCFIGEIKQLNKLKKIKTLDLSNNRIQKIAQIDEMVRIEKLDLGQNRISKIQKLDYLKYLLNLSLSGNQIEKIQNLDELSELQWIDLSHNKISKLQNLQGLQNLHILQLEFNNIQQIENLAPLEQLIELWLSCNKITQISNLEKVIKLKRLGLADNHITKIEGLDKLCSLQLLDLQANEITKIENLENLRELKWLVMSMNKIDKIEGLSSLWQLQNLFLEHNEISVIENLDMLRRLTCLKLQFNNISDIQGLNHLQNLEKLYLRKNNISKISNLENLYNLNELVLRDNKIRKIENLSQLTKIQLLDLSYNQIEKQENIQQLKSLKQLQISNNRIDFLQTCNLAEMMEKAKLLTDSSTSKEVPDDMKNNIKHKIALMFSQFDENSRKKEIDYERHLQFNRQESMRSKKASQAGSPSRMPDALPAMVPGSGVQHDICPSPEGLVKFQEYIQGFQELSFIERVASQKMLGLVKGESSGQEMACQRRQSEEMQPEKNLLLYKFTKKINTQL